MIVKLPEGWSRGGCEVGSLIMDEYNGQDLSRDRCASIGPGMWDSYATCPCRAMIYFYGGRLMFVWLPAKRDEATTGL
jgi:hypothetical protein